MFKMILFFFKNYNLFMNNNYEVKKKLILFFIYIKRVIILKKKEYKMNCLTYGVMTECPDYRDQIVVPEGLLYAHAWGISMEEMKSDIRKRYKKKITFIELDTKTNINRDFHIFFKKPIKFILDKKERDAVNKISNWFLECKYNPQYKYCRDRLDNEYNSYL